MPKIKVPKIPLAKLSGAKVSGVTNPKAHPHGLKITKRAPTTIGRQ